VADVPLQHRERPAAMCSRNGEAFGPFDAAQSYSGRVSSERLCHGEQSIETAVAGAECSQASLSLGQVSISPAKEGSVSHREWG
jgi:hypothetical protein